MRLGLDARTIYRPDRRGTGKNLIDLYHHVACARPDWYMTAYHRKPGFVEPLLPAGPVTPKNIEMIGDRVDAWQRWRLPMAAWRDRMDVLHCPANLCSTWMPIPTVVTIHDLIPLDMPQGQPPAQIRRFAQSVQIACRRAAGIICPSWYTRDRLVREFDADPDRITVNPWAPDSSVKPIAPELWDPVLQRYGVDRPFVLHFGAAAIRKNTRRVIEAWAILEKKARRNCQLLIVGLDEATEKTLRTMVTQLGVKKSVRLHGFADEPDLPTLLSAAVGLAYPSLSEGFGLPILDAWATRTAVLTSDCTSLPEVAGDAAIMVDPTDSCSIARGLKKLIGDPALRSELVQRSQTRLKHYSWRETAARFAQAIEKAVGVSATVRAAA